MHEAAAHISPVLCVTLADDDHVGGNPQSGERPAQSNGLLGFVPYLRLHDQEVQVAVAPGIATGVGPEEDDLGPGSGIAQPLSRLANHRLVDHEDDGTERAGRSRLPTVSSPTLKRKVALTSTHPAATALVRLPRAGLLDNLAAGGYESLGAQLGPAADSRLLPGRRVGRRSRPCPGSAGQRPRASTYCNQRTKPGESEASSRSAAKLSATGPTVPGGNRLELSRTRPT